MPGGFCVKVSPRRQKMWMLYHLGENFLESYVLIEQYDWWNNLVSLTGRHDRFEEAAIALFSNTNVQVADNHIFKEISWNVRRHFILWIGNTAKRHWKIEHTMISQSIDFLEIQKSL